MLTRLEIRDFALIEHVEMLPTGGLHVITGETGAGKSILIDALGAIAGNRIGKDMVRSGRDKAVVEAAFHMEYSTLPADWIESFGLDDDPEIIVSREITLSGRSVARLNGRMVPLNVLRDLATHLLDIHGQFDNQSIFRTETHILLLDRYGGKAMANELAAYDVLFDEYADVIRSVKALGGDPGEREQRLDMLRFQVAEIETADPRLGEDETLMRRRKAQANITHIVESLQKALQYLSGDDEITAMAFLAMAESALEPVAAAIEEATDTLETVREARFGVEEAAMTIRHLLDTVEADPQELERIDRRLDQLYRLKRKYGGSIESVLAFAHSASQELAHAESDQARLEQLQKRKASLHIQLHKFAKRLHEHRLELADGLSRDICAELTQLNMTNARFQVAVERDADDPILGRRGYDRVEFLISPNPGEPLKPLARIASGGEASRMMLAIKTILAEADRTPVLIFDEIDTGVSGQTAVRLGQRLSILSANHQVFCVTHLAQIATMADQHLLIRKRTDQVSTSTDLEILTEEGRRTELARLLSGDEGRQEALILADRMRLHAERFKLSHPHPQPPPGGE